jgi:fido (protein-threonine AMPylation protein)
MADDTSEKFASEQISEIVFSDASTSRQINYAVGQGRLRAIARGLYTSNLSQPLEAVVRRNPWRIAARYFPGAVIADRTALEFRPADDDSVFLVAPRARTVRLPGLVLRARAGEGPIEGDSRWMGENLFMSSTARAVLENLRASRARSGARRTFTRAALEEWLDRYAANDAERLNELRDDARSIAPLVRAERQMVELDDLLRTRDAPMASARGIARKRGQPIDTARLERFEELHAYLRGNPPARVPANELHDPRVFAFYEAYFSNFIEGTEFTLEEAQEIVFDGVIPETRPRDAHDIIGTYRLVADTEKRRRTSGDADVFVARLRDEHAQMLAERHDIRPGVFKERPNRAGSTVFVDPERVEGTLREAYRLFYRTTEPGFARAALMTFVVAEVHPFVDGNGRMARLVMNAELSAETMQRIIVTVRHRDDYTQALRGLAHNGNAAAYVSVLTRLQRDSFDGDYASLTAARRSLEAGRAFEEEASGFVLGESATS